MKLILYPPPPDPEPTYENPPRDWYIDPPASPVGWPVIAPAATGAGDAGGER